MRYVRILSIAVLAAGGLLGCRGELSASGSEAGAAPPSSEEASAPGADGAGGARCGASPPSARVSLRRLSRDEYLNTLAELLPRHTIEEIELAVATVPSDDTDYKESPGDFEPSIDATRLDGLFDVARQAARSIARDDEQLEALGLSCAVAELDRGCARALIESLGRRLFRRALTDEEIEDYASVLALDELGADRDRDRLRILITSMLLDPSFLFVVPRAEAGATSLAPRALAERIALAAWGAPPDEAILEAADAGELASIEGRRAHARRLLESEAGRRHVRQLFRRWLALRRHVALDSSAPNLGLEVDGLYDEMVREALDFVEHLVFEQRGSYEDLMTAPWEFPSTERLAALMGHQSPSPGAVASSSGRAGLLGRPAMLAHVYSRPAPIHRAAHVMFRMLCRDLDVPPNANDVANERLEGIEDTDAVGSRELAAMITTGSCMGCHGAINPLGFALTGYGPLGEVWPQERVYDPDANDGTLLGEFAVDDTVSLPIDGATIEVSGSDGLGRAIATSREGQSCAAKQIFRLTRLRDPGAEEGCTVERLERAIAEGEPLLEVLTRNAADDPATISTITISTIREETSR